MTGASIKGLKARLERLEEKEGLRGPRLHVIISYSDETSEEILARSLKENPGIKIRPGEDTVLIMNFGSDPDGGASPDHD